MMGFALCTGGLSVRLSHACDRMGLNDVIVMSVMPRAAPRLPHRSFLKIRPHSARASDAAPETTGTEVAECPS